MDIEGDAFGKIYEYFLGKFAMTEGQKGGEFFTPDQHRPADRRGHRAVPRPHLRSGLRVGRHVRAVAPASSSTTRRTPAPRSRSTARSGWRDPIRLCKMNLAVHGLSGDIREANTYYEDLARQRRASSTS